MVFKFKLIAINSPDEMLHFLTFIFTVSVVGDLKLNMPNRNLR